jgi:NAD(P)-dependent dehydrogenase (short-subunit alcohol dehydrogenase family)
VTGYAASTEMAGRVALVTGSAGGIGRASALAFAARGAAVIVADVLDAAEETVELIEKNGGTALHARCDVADPNAVRALIDTAVSEYGRLDYAHNNAGVFSPAPLADLDEAEFDRVVRVNLHGVFYCLKYEIKHMRARGDGAIVNTASIWSFVGAGAQAAYAASKHGVMGLTRTA